MNKQEFNNACDYYIDQTAFEATNEQRAFLRTFQQCIEKILEDEEKLKEKERQRVLRKLNQLAKDEDYEISHSRADDIIISYLNDKTITRAYDKVGKFYS